MERARARRRLFATIQTHTRRICFDSRTVWPKVLFCVSTRGEYDEVGECRHVPRGAQRGRISRSSIQQKDLPFCDPNLPQRHISTHKTHNRLDSGVFAYEFVSFIITLLKKECIIVAP